MTFAEFIKNLRTLNLKKKAQRPKMNPNKFYPSQVELQTQEVMREELSNYADKLERAAESGQVSKVYAVPGAVPDGFRDIVNGLAEKVSEFQMRSFANFSELTVGERYFPSQENKEQILSTWTENFVNQCKSTNEEMRKKVAGVVSDGVLEGRNLRDIKKEIKKTCTDFTDNKAELIATTEVGKLNSAIAKDQAQSAGIEYYEWSAAMDGRTRDSHAVMDGKICKWGDDDHYYKWSDPDPKTGKKKLVRVPRPANAYKGAPGTDFRCRCVAIAYVPEFEDDYEEERTEGPVKGVTQGVNADPETKKMLERLLSGSKKIEKKKVELLAQQFKKMESAQKKNLDIAQKLDSKATFIDDGFFIKTDKRRKDAKEKNEVEKYKREMVMAEVAVKNGYPVVFLNEYNYNGSKNPDSVMDGRIVEFKKNNKKKIRARFSEGLLQSKYVYMYVEEKVSFNYFKNEIKREKYSLPKETPKTEKAKKDHEIKLKNLPNSKVYFTIGDTIEIVDVSKL